MRYAKTNDNIYELEAQKVRDKIDSEITIEYCNVRINGIWARLAFAALCGTSLALMGVPYNIISIWFFLTFASQLFELNLSYKTRAETCNIKLRNLLFNVGTFGAFVYCSISPFGWFLGDAWAKTCITWFIVGSIISHTTAAHRVYAMRFKMISPYIIMLPLLSVIQVWFERKNAQTPIILLAITFIFGAAYLIKSLKNKLKSEAIFHELQVERELAHLQAQNANQAKSTYVASISHDLRNPLNAILGSAFLLRQNLESNENVELLDTLLESGNNMILLLNEILDHSKMEAGKLDLENKAFNPSNMLDNIADLWEKNISNKGLEFICDYHGQLPQVLIGDANRIVQIINNLLSNAFKFTKIGWICLKANYENGNLYIEVHDSGIGISEQEKQRLFLPFSQANSEISFLYGGTGLGLSNCSNLVKLMGGKIGVESKPTKGSIFKATIPLALGEIEDIEEERNAGFDINEISAMKMNILAADDNAANRHILGKFIEIIGADLDIVEDGALAINFANNKSYDLILLDVRMPNIDGIEACKEIRKASKFNRETPIIMLSADAALSQIKTGFDAGADGYLPKPIDAAKLYSLIATANGGRGAFAANF
ncbi:MAG: response regulator [Caulobacterales bacterium]|nr:response regulator [Caulobacterales bacterium]MCA0371758.1 response regulator [Pseudomonadota bacterium]